MSNTNEEIQHYQRKLEKYSSDPKVQLHCLNKLTKLSIGVEHLQATGIGRTVNGMRKAEGAVGEMARALVNRWKEMVAAEDEKSSSEEEEEEVEEEKEKKASKHKHKDSEASHHKSKKTKDSRKEKDIQGDSQHRSSSSSSKKKSEDKHSKHKELSCKDQGDSAHTSKSSRKRRRSQEDGSSSQAEERMEEEEETSSRSFADALGSIDTGSSKKSKKSKDKDKRRQEKRSKPSKSANDSPHSSSTSIPPTATLPAAQSHSVLAPLPRSIDIKASDFEISPHYKPLPLKFVNESPPVRIRTTEEALSAAMAQKGARTKVFSGNRSSGLTYVPSLFDLCQRSLQQNIGSLTHIGRYVPFDLLKPALERATAQQLYAIENYNPYLLEDSDCLWQVLCQKEYKKAVPEEFETWRELYLRCHEEREERFRNLTASHKQSMAKAAPVRTTKLAYVDTIARAPRGSGVKSGQTAVLASMTTAKAGARPFEASAHHGSNGAAAVAEVVKLAPPSSSRSSSSASSSAAKKPKVAPLMQKTLKLMKNRFRR